VNQLTLEILGKPISKKRPKFARMGNFVKTYNCQESEEGLFVAKAMDQIRACDHSLPIPCKIPVTITCYFIMPIPKGFSKKLIALIENESQQMPQHTSKPDLDNCVKFLKDCFNKVIWNDDSQIVSLDAVKMYGTTPKTILTVRW